ncbi:MAG TPA: hypothetical protein VJ783_11800, partial [Pirellulales bacterium]|nr:hypothetical protein [Pirellulales bacterium]
MNEHDKVNSKSTGDEPERYFLVLFQRGRRRDPFAFMNSPTFEVAKEYLEGAIASKREKTQLDIWLESPGGDATIAYKFILLARHLASTIRVVIPDYAKSAATLLSIGA